MLRPNRKSSMSKSRLKAPKLFTDINCSACQWRVLANQSESLCVGLCLIIIIYYDPSSSDGQCWWEDTELYLIEFTRIHNTAPTHGIGDRHECVMPWHVRRDNQTVYHLIPITEISHPHPAIKPTCTMDKH